ncbi:hypothetical protein C8R44DRAFT_878436 [Mycena epipterygia]|nr:hypothetical protein C8R44DRAFT_878436 [Mycena epipterygia]
MTNPTPLETARAFLAAILSGDADIMEPMMTEDFSWRLLPAALGIPARNKRDYILQSAQLGRIFASLKVGIDTSAPLDIVQNGDAVVLHVLGEGELATGAAYESEYVMMFWCEGGRVCSMMEFADSEKLRGVLEADDGEGYNVVRQTFDAD